MRKNNESEEKERGEVQKSDDCALSFFYIYWPFGAFKRKKKDSLTKMSILAVTFSKTHLGDILHIYNYLVYISF